MEADRLSFENIRWHHFHSRKIRIQQHCYKNFVTQVNVYLYEV